MAAPDPLPPHRRQKPEPRVDLEEERREIRSLAMAAALDQKPGRRVNPEKEWREIVPLNTAAVAALHQKPVDAEEERREIRRLDTAAMSALDPLPYYLELERGVDVSSSVEREGDWGMIRCRGNKAYGCGELGQKLVDGLAILVRLVGYSNLTRKLCILVSDQARQCIHAQLGLSSDDPLIELGRPGMFGQGVIHSASSRLLLLTLVFRLGYSRELLYYLVYNTIGETLSMIPHLPPHAASPLTAKPVAVCRGFGNCVDLFLVARVSRPRSVQGEALIYDDVLCVWSESSELLGDTVIGREFWADLSLGVMHCDPSNPSLKFKFIPLPSECQFRRKVNLDMEPISMYRTMGCIGNSIKFISIDSFGDVCSRMVRVWTLHLGRDVDTWQWTFDEEFSVSSLWKWKDFKMACLPEMAPKCPILMQDGCICFLLPNIRKRREDSIDDHICSIYMHNKAIIWSGRVDMYHNSEPVLWRSADMKIEPLAWRNQFRLQWW